MQQKRIRGTKPKVFRCTGFGDCSMVFTRSEHLARHSRKHTGEKPFKCIVPHCSKAFSRFDNMMQHTQTHRTHHGGGGKKDMIHTKVNSTRSSTRAQTRKELQVPLTGNQRSECQYDESRSLLPSIKTERLSTFPSLSSPPTSLPSPVSIKYESSCSSSSDEEEEMVLPLHRPRRLSVADLCNPPEGSTSSSHDVHLTKDEFEALEGFGRFRHTPSVFYTGLRNLASNIDHY
ncbi:hypothetical protein K501DRAFT_331055 [Backusella circina FSU 941]|nr:hypothetical protein K501DRAFT_331055 [Backusella circina FSU 941]